MGMKVVIEPPHAGWIKIRVDLGDRELPLRVSYVGGDCVRALTDAVRAFEETGIVQTVDLVGEPELHRLSWGARGAGVALTIGASKTGKPADLLDVARIETATRLELALPFWRALRKLSTEFPPLPNRDWPYAFPEEAVRQLSIAVAKHRPRAR